MRHFFILVGTLILAPLIANDQRVEPAQPALLPLPQTLTWSRKAVVIESVSVALPPETSDVPRFRQLSLELAALLQHHKISVNARAPVAIIFRLAKVEAPGQWEGQANEAYELRADEKAVQVTANTMLGLYRGLQTLRQLMVRRDNTTTVAACVIHDWPAFKIRGFMHDVGRNFQTLDQLRMQIDIMAAHKYSHFHWHLTEYHGWRLESKIYPNLQSPEAFERWQGKFYTQEEFKAMVDYCWSRGITIIPEFDSPGHSTAFRKGVGVPNMRDPRAIKAIRELIAELCSLVGPERMPYIHIGTDEVRYPEEKVDETYLPQLHEAVRAQGREIIGWWRGMTIKGDTQQIQQTWAEVTHLKHLRHIDSRSNYINHLEALDFAMLMHFQQPCRVPHGNAMQLGGILALWPDTKVDDERMKLTNNPVLPAMVAYSEAVWKGIPANRAEYWVKLPAPGTPELASFAAFENRLAEMRDRFYLHRPFPMVKTHDIEWRLLGPVAAGEVPELEQGVVRDRYDVAGKPYNWTAPVRGGAIHIRHFLGYGGHLKHYPKGKDIAWANTHLWSPTTQTVKAWINFNTVSSSDDRAGGPADGNWGAHPACDIWINGRRILPPNWANDGKRGKEVPLTNEVYTSREPSVIELKKGWNTVLIRTGHRFKWVFSFAPVEPVGPSYREVEGLRFSARLPGE